MLGLGCWKQQCSFDLFLCFLSIILSANILTPVLIQLSKKKNLKPVFEVKHCQKLVWLCQCISVQSLLTTTALQYHMYKKTRATKIRFRMKQLEAPRRNQCLFVIGQETTIVICPKIDHLNLKLELPPMQIRIRLLPLFGIVCLNHCGWLDYTMTMHSGPK